MRTNLGYDSVWSGTHVLKFRWNLLLHLKGKWVYQAQKDEVRIGK